MQIKTIPIDQIDQPLILPRWQITNPELQELANSIAETGLIQPIAVVAFEDRYRLVAGNRRLHACRDLLGWTEIEAVIHDQTLSEQDATAVENLHRVDLDPIEEAVLFGTRINQEKLTQTELAQRIGKSRSYIAKRLMLLDLDDKTIQAIIDKQISWTHGLELKRIEDLDRRMYYLGITVTNGVNVRILRDWINQELSRPSQEAQEPLTEETLFEGSSAPYEPLRCAICGRDENEVILHFVPICARDKRELDKVLEVQNA